MTVADIRSLRWADFFLLALVDPRALYRHIREFNDRYFALGFLVPALVAFVDILSMSLFRQNTQFFYYRVTSGLLILFLYYGVRIVIASSLMDMTAQFLGFRGTIKNTITLINFSLFPQIFLLPVMIIMNVFSFAHFYIFVYVITSLGLFLWTVYISVLGLAEMHQTGTGRAVLIFLFPFILVGTVLILIGVLLMVQFFGLLSVLM